MAAPNHSSAKNKPVLTSHREVRIREHFFSNLPAFETSAKLQQSMLVWKPWKSSFCVSAACSALGSWKSPAVPYPSAMLAALWDGQDAPQQRRRLCRAQATAAHPESPTPGCQLTHLRCFVHTRRVLLSSNKNLSRENHKAKKHLNHSAGKDENDSWISKNTYFK